MPSAEAITPPMDWEEAGRAWGARPTDWAYLVEPYARPANEVIFDQLGVGEGTRLLDIACGSGFAAQLAARRGAAVTGTDASGALVTIARARTPEGDFRLGDMFALPFPDASFDVATSFNGIWKGCEAALREAARVLAPGGRLGLTFWGRLDHVGLMPYFLKVIELSPPSHAEANIRQGHTGRPGVIEEMLVSAGFMPRERGTVTVINEWPDAGLAVRALAAAGPSVPAIQAAGFGPFCEALREVIEPLHTPGAGIRIASEFGWITAELRPVDSLPQRYRRTGSPRSVPNARRPRPAFGLDHRMSWPGYPRMGRRAGERAEMTQQAVGYEDCDVPLESGRLRVRRWGAADAPAVVCVPGLSANLSGFDRLAERLAGDTLQLVAIDLRGRGRSEVTGAGTYGWRNHARDVLGIADAVGAPSFAVIGQSSGAAIAMTCAQLEPSRIERLVLVDLAGSPDQRAAVPVVASVSRLGAVYPSAQAAIALIKQIGIVPGWDEYWDRYFLYELRDVDGGVTPASDRGAVLEDLGYGNAMYWPGPDAPIHALWTAITMPALVLRAGQEIMPGFGFILPAAEAERFAAAVPSARVAEIDANHYTITTHDDSIAAIGAFPRTS